MIEPLDITKKEWLYSSLCPKCDKLLERHVIDSVCYHCKILVIEKQNNSDGRVLGAVLIPFEYVEHKG